jgi:CelD/BcsL family acetyltransferase involved in cellulose biosynthesis
MTQVARPLPDSGVHALRAVAAYPAAQTVGPISLSVADDLAAVESEWRAFERNADGTVFQTYAWLSTWQRCIGALTDVRPAIVIGRDGQNKILFLLALATQCLGFGRELVWLGSDLCDYNGPLLAPNFTEAVGELDFAVVWRQILAALLCRPSLQFQVVRLEKMTDSVGMQPNPMLRLPTVPHPSGAWLTPLADSWEAFYAAKRSSATRRRDRGKRRKLAALGQLKFAEPADSAARLRTLDTLMQQKSRSFARHGVANLFERPGYANFYRALAADPDTSALVHISRLDVGEHPGAINFGLTFRRRYYHLLASYSDDPDVARFGPGAAHLNDLMAYAIERGFIVFDFTIGDEPYKADWCSACQRLHDHISARTAAGWLMVLAIRTKQRVKRLIKQNALLWSSFSKARVGLARLSRRHAPAAPGEDDA